jgi:hypothetical protein
MDGHRFDLLTALLSRRHLGRVLIILGLGAGLGAAVETDARKKRKKKKKKKKKTCVNGSCSQTECDAGEIACPSRGCRSDGEFIGCCVEADCGAQPFSDLTCNLTTLECVCEIANEGKCGGNFLNQCDPCRSGGTGICDDPVPNPRVCLSTTPGDCGCPAGTTGFCTGVGCVDQLTNSEHCGASCEDCTANAFDTVCCDAGCRYLGGSPAGGGANTNQTYCGSCDIICGQGLQADKPFCCNSEASSDPATASCLAADQLQGGLCPA